MHNQLDVDSLAQIDEFFADADRPQCLSLGGFMDMYHLQSQNDEGASAPHPFALDSEGVG